MSKELTKKLANIQANFLVDSTQEDSSGIYMIVNPKGNIYVGSSKNIKKRFYQYRGLYEKSQTKLYNSLNKYGVSEHDFIVVLNCDIEDLYKNERIVGDYFNCLDSECGLNLILPAYGEIKLKMSEETKRKIGKAHKGKKLSKDHRESLSKSVKGKKQSKVHIEKRKMLGDKNPMFGKPSPNRGKKIHTIKTKDNWSKIRKNKGLLGKNPNAKKVIDTNTGIMYDSAKEVSIKFNINYSTLKAHLQGRNKNEERFMYV